MAEYGLNDQGFSRKPLDVVLSEINDQFRAVFGDNFNTNPQSPDGQINGAFAESQSNLWEIAEIAYNAFNPSAVTKKTQDNLYQLNGIKRLAASPSTVQLTITGTPNTLIPEGSEVSTTDNEVTFATDIDLIIPSGGEGTVFSTAIETGPLSALAGTVTVINEPITGWDSVTNDADATLGTNEETDPEFRARRVRSTSIAARAVIDAIYAAVANVPGVTQLTVLDNKTLVVDSNGLLPKSTGVIVVGGDDNAIAQAYFDKNPAGIATNGDTIINVPDDQNIPHEIRFQRPTEVDIYVIVNLTVSAEYPVNGDDLIKQAIVDYANGVLIPDRGFFLSDDVIYSRLFTPVNLGAPGHQIDSMFIGIAPAPTETDNIPIALTEISHFTIANIEVNS